MSSKPTGSQLEVTDPSTNLLDINVQVALAKYDTYRQRLRGLISQGKSSFPSFKVTWPCSFQNNILMAGWVMGPDPITGTTTFEAQVREAIRRLSRTKLNNMKRQDGKCCLGTYIPN